MEFLNFELSEFQVLDEFEFDELVQRPERIRFFTLNEQLVDAYEKMIPRGRVTRFQLEQLQKETDKLKDLYESLVVPEEETYTLREPEYGRSFSWIYPIYATSDLNEYSFNESWAPLFENNRLPNFYPRMISAIPRPYASTEQGHPYAISEPTEFLNADGRNPLRALPAYQMTRTRVHEDKTFDILRVPVNGSADNLHFKGYYLAKRPLDIPNPLEGHDFFKANEPTVIETTSALKDVVPSISAILEHGVPVTRDPYKEGLLFLKLYDVRLGDIPWQYWRTRFPPVEVISHTPQPDDIPYPKVNQLKPPEKLVQAYKTEYNEGVSPRFWLMRQEDGGNLVIQMQLSEAINNGSVEMVPGITDVPPYAPTTLEDCNLVGVSFQEFVTKGILRRSWTEDKKGNNIIKYTCAPLEFVRQERRQFGYKNRLPWKETTANDILTRHQIDLLNATPVGFGLEKEPVLPKTPMRNDSERRKEILAVLSDPKRFPEDKLHDIQELVRELPLNNKVYVDADGLFVMCSHTLAILSGDLARDRLVFYDTWTAREEGRRVCKHCGEQINSDVMEDQEDYDDNGFMIKRAEAFQQELYIGSSVKAFATGLEAIKPIFDMKNALDATCYLLLSLLQVLPSRADVEPLLRTGNAIVYKQLGNQKDTDDTLRFRGIVGIAATVLVLQSNPALVPRRSFGSRPLKLSGYPRDAKEPESYTIVDSLMFVLEKTFEAYPSSFRSPAIHVIRAILNNPKSVRKMIQTVIDKRFLQVLEIARSLLDARQKVPTLPTAQPTDVLLPALPPPKEFDVITRMPTCPSARPIWTSGRIPVIHQVTVPLRSGLQPSNTAVDIEPSPSMRIVPKEVPKADIQARLRKKTGLTVRFPVTEQNPIANLMLASRIADMYELTQPTETVDPNVHPDLLRDIAQGFLYDVLRDVQGDTRKAYQLEVEKGKDAALYCLTAEIRTERANVNKLRAIERMRFTERMAKKSDFEREVIQDLLRIGVAPYIITNEDRALFARELERQVEEDTGEQVDQPRDVFDQGEEPVGGVDGGFYGDYNAAPNNDGRDEVLPGFADDNENAI